MQADHLTYKRAAGVAVLGAFVQALMAVLLFIYAFLAREHAAMTATVFIALGIPVWIALAIYYDQHRRERIEAFEAEAFRTSDASGSSVFEEGADELRVAARRLRTMQRVFLPGVSLLVGFLLIGAGLLRFMSGRELVDPDAYTGGRLSSFALGVSIAVAFIGFVLARYVSGMAKQKAWATLGAGASQAIGASMFALALGVGAFVSIISTDVVDRYLQVALPIAMIVLGGEIFLNFLLDLYRPRQAGESVRMAAESRVLSLLAAPDRIAESIGEAINYQLGTDVTGNWFYRLLSRSFVWLVLAGLLVGWGLTSFAVVEPHQRGILTRFGRIVDADVGPGLHIKAPWPVDRIIVPEFLEKDEQGKVVRKVRTATGVRVLHLGSSPPKKSDEPILWTNEHTQQEELQIVRAELPGREGDAQDLALVAIEIPVHYVVEDPLKYEMLAPVEQREDLLRAAGQRAVNRYLASLTMEDVLGPAREEIREALRLRVEEAFNELNPDEQGNPQGAGIRVLFVGAQGAHPPKDVARAFEKVVEAVQNKARRLENARKQAIETLTGIVGSVDRAGEISGQVEELRRLERAGDAVEVARQIARIERLLDDSGGEAAQILAEARMKRWTKHMDARGRAARYAGQIRAFEASPVVYRGIMYFDALAKIIDKSRLFVVSDKLPYHGRLNLEDVTTSAQEVFQSYGEE